MMTLEQAIAKRLNKKRLVREAEARKAQEQKEAIARNEASVAEQARRILSDCLEIDLSEVTIRTAFSHANKGDETSYYNLLLRFPDGAEVFADSAFRVDPGLIIDPEVLLSANWRAYWKKNTNRTTVDNDLVEMIIFARYGTVEPDVQIFAGGIDWPEETDGEL